MEWDSTLLSEDDSLIQPTPTRMAIHISPMKYSTIREDLVKDNCSSSKDTSNKENIGVNKSEGAKLNMEPVQMKKKRKGGGYNLRKSLAWDRAFLTEEGVLDPLELSMISGTNVNSSREGLSTINEDDSLSNDYVSHSDSPDLQALEKNLFKEAHAVSAKKDRGSVHLPPEHNSPARSHRASTSVASPRVLPSRGANKTGSRTGGCPRPLPLSSLKRPANTNASQTATKESKFPRIPVSKPGRSSSIVSKKSVTQEATHVKQTQIQQPVVSLQNQRNVALKSSPKSVKNNKDRPKPSSGSLSVKSLVSHSKRTAVKSPIYPNSSAQLNPSLGSKVTNTNAKVIPAGVSPSIAVPLSECQDITTKLPSSLPCGTSITSRTLQHKQLPSLKPSGLRMPSPSLGFFGQPKNSFSHTASRRAKEADIPGLRKPGYLRPPNSPVEIAKVVTDMKQNVDTVVLGSRSDFQSFSHEGMKQNVGEDAEEESLKILNEDELSEPLNDRNILSGNIGSSGLGCRESERPTDVNWENWEPCPQQSSMNCDKCLSRAGNSMENSSVEHSDVLESSSGEAIIEVPCGNEYLSGGKGSGSKDSQNLSNENLETADFVTPASREIELKCLEPSSRENCTNLEKSLILEDANPQSHNVETEAQMTNIISTSECKNNVNRHSEVGDLNSSSSKSLELQSPYIAPNSQNKHGLAAADILLVEEGSEQYILEVTKKLPVTELDAACKSELDSSGEISQVSVRAQDEHSEVRKMLGEVLVKDSSKTFFGIASSVENHNCSVTRYLVSDINCSGEITSLSHSALNEGSKSLVTYECGTFDGKDVQNRQANENDLMVEEPENITLLIPPASEIADLSCGSSLTESKFDVEDQNTDHQNIPEPNSNFHDFPEMPLEKSNISPTATARQIEELGREVTSSSSILQVEDEAVQEPDCSVPLEYCINLVHEASDQFTPIVPGKRSGEAGFPNFCVLVEKVPEVNGSLPTANCLSRETTLLSELEENTILESGVGEVPKTIDARGGELESSRPHSSMPLLMHFSDDLGDESNGSSYIVHTTSSCVEVEPSPESYDPFAGSEMKHDSEHGGFLVQDLTSSRYGNQADSRLKKNPLLGERKIQFASDTENLAEGSDSELDAALCVVENKDTTASIKNSGSSSSGNSVVIIPPRNAVPFSDEWLAAMEAAGEDILKMKSGAVQNSPTDKSLPEPSPWSPVRRKNNAIGPFDCTKFTNNIPSDSQ